MTIQDKVWFDTKLDWAKIATILGVIGTMSLFLVNTWSDNKTQLLEFRAAINSLGQKLDDNMGKQNDRLTTAEREMRLSIDAERENSNRERQVLRDRIIALEARRIDDDKRSRESDVNLATLREQMNNVVITINSLHDVIIANRPSVVASPSPRK